MDNFTRLLLEVKNVVEDSITLKDLDEYINKTSKILPIMVKDALYLIKKYEILDGKDINTILNANKSSLKGLADKYNITEGEMDDLWKLLKDLKNNIKLLPHFLTSQERSAFMKGKIMVSDLTIDLDTPQGKNDVVNQYMPIAHKIVNQYVGKSKLSREDLMSVALEAFTLAMKEWDRSKGQLFKTYLSYRIQQLILNEIDAHGHSLSGTNWYATKKYGGELLDAISLDSLPKDENGDFQQDRLAALGIDDEKDLSRDEEKSWKQVFALLERKFKQRDLDIFYRYFGLNGYKREKSKDIAKDYGMSEGNIRNSIINKIIAFLKKDRKSMELLLDLQDMYNEHLMIELFGFDRDYIIERLAEDDIYILLEEINRWTNKNVFKRALDNSLPAGNDKFILDILNGDFEDVDNNIKKYKKDIIKFLSNMYPTENMAKKTDVDLIEYMVEIQEIYKNYKK
jgi:RNA polymerase sigma factor (sigma-70 family)